MHYYNSDIFMREIYNIVHTTPNSYALKNRGVCIYSFYNYMEKPWNQLCQTMRGKSSSDITFCCQKLLYFTKNISFRKQRKNQKKAQNSNKYTFQKTNKQLNEIDET